MRKASFSSGVPIVTRRQSSRRGQLLQFHDTMATADDPDSQATAQALRKHFKAAVGGHWPTSPGWWTKYAGALPGIAFLAATTGLLLGMRLLLGTETDWLAVSLASRSGRAWKASRSP